jgi:osmotically-inducible protein OsmY
MQLLNNINESALKVYSKQLNHQAFKMPKRFWLFILALMASLMLINFNVHAESAPVAVNSEVDNTEVNVRDSANTTLTPEDQKETSGDRKITASIRQAIIKIKSLSLDAHNAKIITRNGVVTLRGPVENAAEKIKLQAIAAKTRRVKQVDNQLEPKTP